MVAIPGKQGLFNPFLVKFSVFKQGFISILIILISLGFLATTAQAESQQITLSLDGTKSSTFEDLVRQAESLAEATITQKFKTEPNLTELKVTVLAERDGQVASLLASTIARQEWKTQPSLRQRAQYFTSSNVLLGYANTAQIAQNRAISGSRPNPPTDSPDSPVAAANPAPAGKPGETRTPRNAPSPANQDPRQTVEEAMKSGRISDSEYWRLIDALD